MSVLEEIGRRYSVALDAKPGKGDITKLDALIDSVADVPRLLAALDAVLELANQWDADAGPRSEADAVFGPQKVSVEFAVYKLRNTITTALEER